MSNDRKYVVLVADDEPSTLALLGRHLRARGYTVLEANDGDEAWELAHEHLPHLVILDVMMPGMSGWEVCRKIREAVSLAHTGVIMLTGIGEALNEMTSPLYGADAHVDKPFEFADLDAKIEQTLEQRQSGTLGRPDAVEEIRLEVRRAAPEEQTVRLPLPRTVGKAPAARKTAEKAEAIQAKPAPKAKPAPQAKPAPKAKPVPAATAKPAPKTKPLKKAQQVVKAVVKVVANALAKAKAPAKKPAPKAKPVAKAKPARQAKPVAKAKAKAKPVAKAKAPAKAPAKKAAAKAKPAPKAAPASKTKAAPKAKAKAPAAAPSKAAAGKKGKQPPAKGDAKPAPKKSGKR